MTGPYDDMLNLPHPTSRRHSRMSRSDRAAQFAPFAALSGHGTAIAETARLTERRIELDEDVKAALDFKQQMLMDRIDEHPDVSVTWFQPDGKKDGGRYVTTVSYTHLVTSPTGRSMRTAATSHRSSQARAGRRSRRNSHRRGRAMSTTPAAIRLI